MSSYYFPFDFPIKFDTITGSMENKSKFTPAPQLQSGFKCLKI